MVRTLYRLKIPPPLLTNDCIESSAFEYLDASVPKDMGLLVAQSHSRFLRDEANHDALHVAAVLAPSPAAFAVGKPSTKINISFIHASTGHVNEFLMRRTSKLQGVRLTGALLPCVGCLEAKGRKAPVQRREVTRATVPFERVHINLCGPLKPALNGSIYIIKFVDSALRW